jgi:SAM-dependent methyltransferase
MTCDGNHPQKTPAQPGQPWTPDVCLLCWRALNRPAQVVKHGGPRPPVNQRRRCRHRGDETGDRVQCPTCRGRVQLKVFSCAIHGTCVLEKPNGSVRDCASCADHEPGGAVPEAGSTRHLLFHLYPVRDNEVWRWHLRKLREKASCFNGKKILALALDYNSESAEAVRRECAGLFDEVLEFPNKPDLREVVSFEELFSRVRSLDPAEAILWGHSKGVGRGPAHGPVYRWAELQHEIYTDLGRVLPLLQEYPVVGAFKKLGYGWSDAESLSDWHFSGSWFWARSRDLFAQADWRRIDRIQAGIESYPSLHFSAEEAGCLFHEGVVPDMNLYSDAYWRDVVEPAYRTWRGPGSAPPPSASPESVLGQWYAWLRAQPSPRILEVGVAEWDGREPKHHRDAILALNPRTEWVGLDVKAGRDVSVVADLHEISRHFPAAHFDGVFCASVLEHLRRPWVAAKELAAVVKPGGRLLVQTHQSFPVHGYPSDFFRFTREGLAEVFAADTGWRVLASEYQFPAKVVPLDNQMEDWNFAAEAWLNVAALVERV